MTQKDLIAAVAADSGMTKKDAKFVVSSVLDNITGALTAGDRVVLPGFGTFVVKERAARDGFNPATNQPIRIQAKKVVKFNVGAALAAGVAD